KSTAGVRTALDDQQRRTKGQRIDGGLVLSRQRVCVTLLNHRGYRLGRVAGRHLLGGRGPGSTRDQRRATLAAEVTPLWVLMSTVGTERHCSGFRLLAPKGSTRAGEFRSKLKPPCEVRSACRLFSIGIGIQQIIEVRGLVQFELK